nr:dbp1 [Calliteara abietis nucleopolyhedrovirus]
MSKRSLSDQQQQQQHQKENRLSVFSKSAGCDEIVQIEEIDCDATDNAVVETQNNLLCRFDQCSTKRARFAEVTWMDELLYNLKIGNHTVVCDDLDELRDLVLPLDNKLNLDEHFSKMYPTPDQRISVEKAIPPRVVNHVGYRVHGGLMQFYFFDEVTMKLCVGKHGPFMKLFWSQLPRHNRMMANIIISYNGWEGQMIKMQDDVLVNVPSVDEKSDRADYIKRFFNISRERNESVYAHGIRKANKPLVCDVFDSSKFEETFRLNTEDSASASVKPSNSVKMLMYAVLDGYKVGKDKELETVYNKKVTEKPFTVAITPICYFNIEL